MCKDKDGNVRFSTMDMITSGKTGQTSATGTAGVALCFLSILVILALVIEYFVKPEEAGNVLAFFDKITVVLGIGAALLGTRKISGAIASKNTANVVDIVEDTIQEMEQHGHGRRPRRDRVNEYEGATDMSDMYEDDQDA